MQALIIFSVFDIKACTFGKKNIYIYLHIYQKQEVNTQQNHQNHGFCLYVALDVTVVGVCNDDVYSSSYYFSTILYHLANGSNSSFSEQHLNNNQELCKA